MTSEENPDKTKIETLLIEDLLSPRAFDQWKRGELDLFSNIPVRTWATGSPLKHGDDDSGKKEREYDPEELVDYSEGLDAYFTKNVGQIEEGQDDENENDDALINEMEDYLADDDNDDQAYSPNFHDESVADQFQNMTQKITSSQNIDQEDTVLQADEEEEQEENVDDADYDYEEDDDADENEKAQDDDESPCEGTGSYDENDYEDDYEPANLEQSQNKGYNGLFDLQANCEAEEDDDEDDENEDDVENDQDDDDDNECDVEGIANDYNDLLMYMNSPREGQQVVAEQSFSDPKSVKDASVVASSRILPAKPAQRVKGKVDKKKSALSTSSKRNQPKQKGKKKHQQPKSSGNGNEAIKRHKDMLAAMAIKRKQEEEEIAQLAELEKERRKKFKEALLEKAMKSKKAQEDALNALTADKIPTFLHPTNAFKAQSVSKKAEDQVNLTEEEVLQQDQQKREYIAQIRRKFKEQHKKTLMALVAKKREEEAKNEQRKQEEEIQKEKRRQKLLKLLAEKEASIINYNRGSSPSGDDNNEKAATCSNVSEEKTVPLRKKRPSMDGRIPVSTPPSAAGSGLAAIRSRQQAPSEESDAANAMVSKDKTSQQQQQSSASAQNLGEQKAKLSEYLQALAEQKKKEGMEKQKMEERKKRRVALLRERILQEGAERKLMMMEDDTKYQIQASGNIDEEKNKTKKSKKITPEMAEAMAQRLGSCKSASQNTSQPNMVPKPPTVAKKSASSAVGPITSSSAPSTAVPTAKDSKDKPEPRAASNNRSAKLRESVSADTGDENQPSNSLLSSTTSTAVSSVPARDFKDWKRKNHVPNDGKVFCMTGWYPCVKQTLLDRGWFFNADPASPYFHLKWTLRSLDVNHESLQSWQLINHFMKNIAITTKCGLIKSLQSLKWMADVDCNDIIPRAYDLSVQHDIQAFLDDFRSELAENILKKLYLSLTGIDKIELPADRSEKKSSSSESEDDNSGEIHPEQSTNTVEGGESIADVMQAMSNDPVIPPMPPVVDPSIFSPDSFSKLPSYATINPAVFDSTCRILESLLKPYEDAYLDDDSMLSNSMAGSFLPGGSNNNQPSTYTIPVKIVSDLDWEIVENYDLYKAYPQGLPCAPPESIDNFLSSMFNSPEGDGGVDTSVELRLTHAIRREKKKHSRWLEEQRQQAHERIKACRCITLQDVERIHLILHRLQAYHGPQYRLNGTANVAQNMWIVKPASKSRGRGIMTFNNLPKLLKYVQISNTVAGSGSAQWIVQKYMENPLIIANRKFDMRQWVLVYDWNPLTIYFYEEFYARFSVEEYSVDNTDMDNVYVHLVNNSIGKNSENFNRLVTADNGVPIEGYMWSYDDFSAYVAGKNNGRNIVKEKIQPRMKEIAKWALMCGSESIEHRKNSWELYGFDYMVDDDYNAWLIEINSSPACDYSTKVTERYVQKALVESLSIVLDTREWEQQPKKSRGSPPDVGGWECIYKGPAVELPAGSFGTEMTLKGEGYKGLKRVAPPLPPSSSTVQQGASSAVAAATGEAAFAPMAISLRSNPLQGNGSRKLQQPSPSHRSHGDAGTTSSARQPSGPSPPIIKKTAASSVPPVYDESDDAFNDSDDDGSVGRAVPHNLHEPTNAQGLKGLQSQSSKNNRNVSKRSGNGIAAPATATAASNNGGVGAVPVPVKTFTLEL